ncbi:MAG TPA: hypothetical protein VF970_09965 [Gemmatimonadales bacterium]
MTASHWGRLAVLGAAALAVVTCREPSPVGPPAASLLGGGIQIPGLLTCAPRPSDSVTRTIGSEGGVLQVGPHTLSVPAGALVAPVTIMAVAPSETVNQVRFQPEGLHFQQPASLTLSYANCDLLGLPLPPRIAYTTDALAILEYLPSLDHAAAQRVTGELGHFSSYAVAW